MKRFTCITLHADSWPVQQQCQASGVDSAAQRVFTASAGCGPNYGAEATPWAGSGGAADSAPTAYAPSALVSAPGHHAPPEADPQAVAAANRLATWPWPRGSGPIWLVDATLFPGE